MKSCRFLLFFLFSSFLLSAQIALDGGGLSSLKNNFDSSLELESDLYCSLWGSLLLNPQLSLDSEVSVSGNLRTAYLDAADFHFLLEEFNLSGLKNDTGIFYLEYSLGRQSFSDITGRAINVSGDGVNFDILSNGFPLDLWFCYTGLCGIESPDCAVTTTDAILQEQGLFQGPRRIYESFSFGDPEGYFSLDLSGFQDLNGVKVDPELVNELMNSVYATSEWNFQVLNSLFLSSSFTTQGGFYIQPSTGNAIPLLAAALSLSLEIINPAGLAGFRSELYISSGDDWSRGDWYGQNIMQSEGPVTLFTPVNPLYYGYINPVSTGNLTFFLNEFRFRPSRSVYMRLKSLTFFRTTNGPMSIPELSEELGDVFYLGEEISGDISIFVFPELEFRIKGGVLIPPFELNEFLKTEMKAGVDVVFTF